MNMAIFGFIGSHAMELYFVYAAGLFALLLVSLIANARKIKEALEGLDRKWLLLPALVVLAFLISEVLLVKPTFWMYKDEYIEMSIGKVMIFNHEAGICSFNIGNYCMPDGIGLFQQSDGWPLLFAIAFSIFGVSFATAYNLTLLMSCISVLLVFFIIYLISKNKEASLVGAIFLAFTPVFMTYSRSTTLDVPAVTFVLLTLFASLVYLNNKKLASGIMVASVAAFTMLMRIELGLFVPILLAFLFLPNLPSFNKKELRNFVIALSIFLLLALPEFAFIYTSLTANKFGAPNGRMFSFQYFKTSIKPDLLFWLGLYANVYSGPYVYHDEYPIIYTLLGVIGALYLLRHKKSFAVALITYFLLVIIFFSSFYAGSIFGESGANLRYYLQDFAIMAIFAALGSIAIIEFIAKRYKHLTKSNKKLILLIIVAAALLMPIVYINKIVMLPPSSLYPYAPDRAELSAVEQVVNKIPQNCIVLSYKPQLWYLLGKNSMFADWIFLPNYKNQAVNLSDNCIYFDYGTACLGAGPYPNGSMTRCNQIMQDFNMTPIIAEPYDKDGWNFTIGIYHINGYKNSTKLGST